MHDRQRFFCKDCKGGGICIHDKDKRFCKICDGSMLCTICKLNIVNIKDTTCKTCDPTVGSRSRCREKQMEKQLQIWAEQTLIPNYTTWNKINPLANGIQCGNYRPDFLYEWDEGALVLEYDEQMHKDRIKRCELVRQAEVSMGFGGKPTVWVRFNPDAFKVNGATLTTTKKQREAVLLETLEKHIGNANYDYLMQVVYICYDKGVSQSGDSDYVQTFQFATMEKYEEWVNEIAPVQ